jgi:hypothetical protein
MLPIVLLIVIVVGTSYLKDPKYFRRKPKERSQPHLAHTTGRTGRIVLVLVVPTLFAATGLLAILAYGRAIGDPIFQGTAFVGVLLFVVLLFALLTKKG